MPVTLATVDPKVYIIVSWTEFGGRSGPSEIFSEVA